MAAVEASSRGAQRNSFRVSGGSAFVTPAEVSAGFGRTLRSVGRNAYTRVLSFVSTRRRSPCRSLCIHRADREFRHMETGGSQFRPLPGRGTA